MSLKNNHSADNPLVFSFHLRVHVVEGKANKKTPRACKNDLMSGSKLESLL